MKIGVIGLGVVGRAIYDGLGQLGHEMSHYDIADQSTSIDSVRHTDIVFVCVPTPTDGNGNCDVTNVYRVVRLLNASEYTGIIAIKSTVIPGTTQHLIDQYPDLKICFVPEFLRERSALSDFVGLHDVLIVGTSSAEIHQQIVTAHQTIPDTACMIGPTEAEIAKYFNNVFNALRVTFANDMFELCNALGANYQQVFGAVSHRKTVGRDYLRCSDSLRGFSGTCLPKDTQALATLFSKLNLGHIELIGAILKDNQHHIKE